MIGTNQVNQREPQPIFRQLLNRTASSSVDVRDSVEDLALGNVLLAAANAAPSTEHQIILIEVVRPDEIR